VQDGAANVTFGAVNLTPYTEQLVLPEFEAAVSSLSLTAMHGRGSHELPFLGISSMSFQSCFSPEHLICVKGFRCLPQREDGFRSHREKRWRPGVS